MANEWTVWNGGDCPVDTDAFVDIVVRRGDLFTEMRASRCDWNHSDPMHDDYQSDIIEYKLSDEPYEE